VVRESSTGEDVTEEYVDLEVRRLNTLAQVERLRALSPRPATSRTPSRSPKPSRSPRRSSS
jgi:hypothetical protein